MLVRIDTRDGRPLYDQIAAGVRSALRNGDIAAGERLPATRDLAASLGVNMHTVLRAYALLRDEGIIELRRGRGAVVVAAPRDDEVARLVSDLVRAARRQGLDAADISRLIRQEMS